MDGTDKCYSALVSLSTSYKNYAHGYASLVICVAGSITNIINIIVLTRKNMISPIHIVLTGLAIADLALLLNYIPLTWHQYLRPSSADSRTYGWTLFALWSNNFSLLCRAISVWMTIILAVWRYMAIVYPLTTQNWCNIKTTYRAVVAGYVLSPLLCIPAFITGAVVEDKSVSPVVYDVAQTDKEILNVTFPAKWSHFIHSVFKLIPSIVLTMQSLRLVIR